MYIPTKYYVYRDKNYAYREFSFRQVGVFCYNKKHKENPV